MNPFFVPGLFLFRQKCSFFVQNVPGLVLILQIRKYLLEEKASHSHGVVRSILHEWKGF